MPLPEFELGEVTNEVLVYAIIGPLARGRHSVLEDTAVVLLGRVHGLLCIRAKACRTRPSYP